MTIKSITITKSVWKQQEADLCKNGIHHKGRLYTIESNKTFSRCARVGLILASLVTFGLLLLDSKLRKKVFNKVVILKVKETPIESKKVSQNNNSDTNNEPQPSLPIISDTNSPKNPTPPSPVNTPPVKRKDSPINTSPKNPETTKGIASSVTAEDLKQRVDLAKAGKPIYPSISPTTTSKTNGTAQTVLSTDPTAPPVTPESSLSESEDISFVKIEEEIPVDLVEDLKQKIQKMLQQDLLNLLNSPEPLITIHEDLLADLILEKDINKLTFEQVLFAREIFVLTYPNFAPFLQDKYQTEEIKKILNAIALIILHGKAQTPTNLQLRENEKEGERLTKASLQKIKEQCTDKNVQNMAILLGALRVLNQEKAMRIFEGQLYRDLQEKYASNLTVFNAIIQTLNVKEETHSFGQKVFGAGRLLANVTDFFLSTIGYSYRNLADLAGTTATGALNIWARKGVRNILESDNPEVNKLKASKYQSLVNPINLPPENLKNLEGFKAALVQLKAIAQDPTATNSDPLSGFTPVYLDNLRKAYRAFLATFRGSIQQAENGHLLDEERDFLYEQAYNFWTMNEMGEKNQELIQLFNKDKKLNSKSLTKQLAETSQNVHQAPSDVTTFFLNRLGRSAWDLYDFHPLDGGNPPQRLQPLKINEKDITILGMGVPTRQMKTGVEIEPIFKGYLYHLKKLGQTHLYFSFQNMEDPGEELRNKAVMALQNTDAFKWTFYGVTFARNTPFFKGEKEVSGEEQPRQCKALGDKLHAQFFYDTYAHSGCSISEQVHSKAANGLQTLSKEFIAGITKFMEVGEAAELTPPQAALFKEIYYALMALAIISIVEPSNINFTCRDGIDRGMEFLAWFYQLLIKTDKTKADKPAAFKLLSEALFTRVYWVRKRPMQNEQLDRYMSNAKELKSCVKNPAKRVELGNLILQALGKTEAHLTLGKDPIVRNIISPVAT